jgi:hypothetical protein
MFHGIICVIYEYFGCDIIKIPHQRGRETKKETRKKMTKETDCNREPDTGGGLRVRDLYEAACLSVHGCQMQRLDVEQSHGKPIAHFVFLSDAKQLSDDYRMGQVTVNALLFTSAIERCKDRLFEALRTETRRSHGNHTQLQHA